MSSKGLDKAAKKFSKILEGLEHPPLGMAAALAEECGEVSSMLLDHHVYGRPLDRKALAHELMDVFVCLCEIAQKHRVSMDEALVSKVADLEERAPRWRVELAEALKQSRIDEGRDS